MKRRSLLRSVLVPAAVGLLSVSVAWAGAGLAPLSVGEDPPAEEATTSDEASLPPVDVHVTTQGTGPEPDPFMTPGESALPNEALSDGWFHVGAAKVSLYPRPGDYGGNWVRDPSKCDTLSEEGLAELFGGLPDSASHIAAAGSPWPENPDCIYVGGYDLGPMNSVKDFDAEYGLWSRAVVISSGADEYGPERDEDDQPLPDGKIDTLVLVQLDGEGWFWDYASKCDHCGWKQIGQRLAAELGTSTSSFIFHATHSHTAMDFIGGWGFVPDWYMEQAVDTIEESVRRAVDNLEPARLEVGEVLTRELNRERRDTYHAPEEPGMSWLRAFVPHDGGYDGLADHPSHPPARMIGRTIATIGTFAAHPTNIHIERGHEGHGIEPDVAHADYPGLFAAGVEDRFGGVGMHLMTGLGNMSTAAGLDTGSKLAERVPTMGRGELIRSTSIRTAEHVWNQPVTNVPLTALGTPGFFDRKFNPTPASVNVGPSDAPCVSASPSSVEVVARAATVGDRLLVTSGPGEMFSNSTNTIKEKAAEPRQLFAMPIAQANDALGYLPESFEQSQNPASGQGGGFAESGPMYLEYEDAYAIDRCFGDANLEYTLGLLGQLFG